MQKEGIVKALMNSRKKLFVYVSSDLFPSTRIYVNKPVKNNKAKVLHKHHARNKDLKKKKKNIYIYIVLPGRLTLHYGFLCF